MNGGPERDDAVARWLKRKRDEYVDGPYHYELLAVDRLLNRYRECADYGLSLEPVDDASGDP